jgi:hypothetical protein
LPVAGAAGLLPAVEAAEVVMWAAQVAGAGLLQAVAAAGVAM